MKERKLICIGCPLGCGLTVLMENEKIKEIKGYTCKRGKNYAEKEVTAPSRIVTTTVRVRDGFLPVVSVKTQSDIPKEKIEQCIQELYNVEVKAPVKIGDLICSNIANTGVDVIATKYVPFRRR